MKNRTVIIAIALIVPFAAWSNYALWQKFTQPATVYQVQVIERTVVEQVMTTIDLDRIRDTSAATDHEPQLLAECAYAIQRHTDEPLAGIIHYAERYWQADTCAAYEHLMVHGWY
jgi:hypothetical protein